MFNDAPMYGLTKPVDGCRMSVMDTGLLDYCLARLPAKEAELKTVAAACGVPWKTLIKIKRGETLNPRIDTLQRVYNHLRQLPA